MIKVAMGIDSGMLQGKAMVRQYWHAAFERVPDLHFELIECTQSFNSIAIYYKAVMERWPSKSCSSIRMERCPR
jgi:hypothetical protein